MSRPILQEYKKALSYPKVRKLHRLTNQEIDETIGGFRRFSTLIEPKTKLTVIKADFIVSGDKHLLELKEYQGIQIFTPRAFLLALSKE